MEIYDVHYDNDTDTYSVSVIDPVEEFFAMIGEEDRDARALTEEEFAQILNDDELPW